MEVIAYTCITKDSKTRKRATNLLTVFYNMGRFKHEDSVAQGKLSVFVCKFAKEWTGGKALVEMVRNVTRH
jgi:hypothetical protein